MKTLINLYALFFCLALHGQIEQNINKIGGIVIHPIGAIDSIYFNGGQTEIQIVLTNGTTETHAISEVYNITFAGQYPFPAGTVNCAVGPTAVVNVINPSTGRSWMDRNLGASQVATSLTDVDAYGDFYQWGRGSDGHQCRTAAATTTLSSVSQPIHDDFIIAPAAPNDWLIPQNQNLWQGLNGVNNPCPTTYRLPTAAELSAEQLSWISNNSVGAFASPLKWCLAGARYNTNGSINQVGFYGIHWSSTAFGAYSTHLYFYNGGAAMTDNSRAAGFSVRCIKD